MTHLSLAANVLSRWACTSVFIGCALVGATPAEAVELGVARVDVTPTEPIRLTGYASRKTSHVGVEQKLWAKALAIGSDRDGAAVLITLDNCGIADQTWRTVRRRLQESARIQLDRVVIASSHTHSAPATTGWAPNIFVQDLTAEEQGAIDRYTVRLIAQLESVAREALTNRQEGTLSWSEGAAGFAANRRTAGGPVDHALPVLKAETADGRLLALVANYACHCTTLGGEVNRACGDWAGYAQEAIEREAPGAVAFVTIGCGADANPSPRGGADGGIAFAKKHGAEVGTEVKRLLGLNFNPLVSRLSSGAQEIDLPFAPHFTTEQWAARSTNAGIVGYHARKWQARLARGEKPPASLYYPITTWTFGNDLALVFLPGEVVIDYALRLKRELDGRKLWVTGYANYVPCYIPSRRILAEGGYEAEDSLWYYDRPARISTNAEDLIIRTVTGLVPNSFRTGPQNAEHPAARTPNEALKAFRLATNLVVELAAAEPQVQSPVAIDWDAQGRLWVCEMYDYPSGLNPPADVNRKYGEPLREPPGGFTPGGRVKILTDTDGDGRYDRSVVFLRGIPFPTGVMPWGRGALICAAPNILYAEDTDGDGTADVVRTNITGFATHNYQARVNGFAWGLDGWLHGSSGLFGGRVRSLQTGKEVDLSGRDFRYRPATGEIEPVAGISQMGRIRDDFDQWFGNDNSTLLSHYPLPDHYLRRNPHVVYPQPNILVARGSDVNRLFPASRTLTRFNDPQMANIVTSACGPGLYRDELLGAGYSGNAFICEPVHNLVRRLVLEPDGVAVAGRRAAGEERTEFLASSDNWFRPVQARTGPDGALYIVDMYRFVIEHARWIPPDRLRELDVRAGADLGRIYRVRAKGVPLRPIPNLRTTGDEKLARALDTPNGPVRDLVQQEIVSRTGQNRLGAQQLALGRILDTSRNPAVRAQALATLGEDALASAVLPTALSDSDPRVRRIALRVVEPRLAAGQVDEALASAFLGSVSNVDRSVRLQAALSLGEWNDPRAARALAQLADENDRWMRAAILSSAAKQAPALLTAILERGGSDQNSELISGLIATALGRGQPGELAGVLQTVAPKARPSNSSAAEWLATLEPWRWRAITAVLESLRSREMNSSPAGSSLEGAGREAMERLREVTSAALDLAGNEQAAATTREPAIRLLGVVDSPGTTSKLAALLATPAQAQWHSAVVDALARSRQKEVGPQLVGTWDHLGPSLRTRVIGLLLNRSEWSSDLVNALERDQIRPSELSPAQRQRLLAVKESSLQERAAKILAGATPAGRAEALKKFEPIASLTGNGQNGVMVFDQHCAQCHALRGRGHEVGPNLAEFAGKSISDFLLAILDPNAGLNPNFLAYNVELKDGRALTGIVRDETASSLTVVQGGGVRDSVLRTDIASLRASSLSLMPEGVEQAMTPQNMADLIAWLKGSRPPAFGRATTQQAADARAEFFRSGASTGLEVTRAFERLSYPGWLGRWPMAYCRQNAGQERLVWKASARKAEATDRVAFRFPVAMGLLSQAGGGFTLRMRGRSVFNFDVTLGDREWTSADGSVRMNYRVREANGEDSCGLLEIEAPMTLAKSGDTMEFEVVGAAANSQRWFGLYLVEK